MATQTYLFGVTSIEHTRVDGERLNAIAERHGAGWNGPLHMPGNPNRGWFSAEAQGNQEAIFAKVMADVRAELPQLYRRLFRSAK